MRSEYGTEGRVTKDGSEIGRGKRHRLSEDGHIVAAPPHPPA